VPRILQTATTAVDITLSLMKHQLVDRLGHCATRLDEICRRTFVSILLLFELKVSRAEGKWSVALNGEPAAFCDKSARVCFKNLLSRKCFENLQLNLNDRLGTQADLLRCEVENLAGEIEQGGRLLVQKIASAETPNDLFQAMQDAWQDVNQLEQLTNALEHNLRLFSTTGGEELSHYDSAECERIANTNSGNVLVSPQEETNKGDTHRMTTRNELSQVFGIRVPTIRDIVRQTDQIIPGIEIENPEENSPRISGPRISGIFPASPAFSFTADELESEMATDCNVCHDQGLLHDGSLEVAHFRSELTSDAFEGWLGGLPPFDEHWLL
jgi:hypothetical protein